MHQASTDALPDPCDPLPSLLSRCKGRSGKTPRKGRLPGFRDPVEARIPRARPRTGHSHSHSPPSAPGFAGGRRSRRTRGRSPPAEPGAGGRVTGPRGDGAPANENENAIALRRRRVEHRSATAELRLVPLSLPIIPHSLSGKELRQGGSGVSGRPLPGAQLL